MICVSNPPYNMKWDIPQLAQEELRFKGIAVPPKGNANFAFVLTAFENCEKCVYILPNCVLSSDAKQEKEIRKYLVEKNYIEAIILCPDKMFEATSIATCILVLNKKKDTQQIVFVDMRKTYVVEKREQNGQFGGKSKTNRTYTKDINVFSDEHIEKCLDVIKNKKNIAEFSKSVGLKEVAENNFDLTPSLYIEFIERETKHREYKDIVNDINRIVEQQNLLKLTVNENIAKNILGLDISLFKAAQAEEIELPKELNLKITKKNYITFTKNKNELKFENNSKENLSEILMQIFFLWKSHIMFLNNEENRYLAELRDALLPDLLSGKINVD